MTDSVNFRIHYLFYLDNYKNDNKCLFQIIKLNKLNKIITKSNTFLNLYTLLANCIVYQKPVTWKVYLSIQF